MNTHHNVIPFDRRLAATPVPLEAPLPKCESVLVNLEVGSIAARWSGPAPSGSLSIEQLEVLVGGLEQDEAITACIDLTERTSGLSFEITCCGDGKAAANARGRTMGALLKAALHTALPVLGVKKAKRRGRAAKLGHCRKLRPAGLPLALGAPPLAAHGEPAGGRVAPGAPGKSDEFVVLPMVACGPSLAGLGAALGALRTPLQVVIRMKRARWSNDERAEIERARARINGRFGFDQTRFLTDPRYVDAERRLEGMSLAGGGVRLDVEVRSKRKLCDSELSAISAALFGVGHATHQTGMLARMRTSYVMREAVLSFLGIVVAGAGPAFEHREARKLRGGEGNIVGRVETGQAVRMPIDQPRSHTYCIGRTGTGKSTLILNLILQDIAAGRSVILIDPHGDLWSDVRDRLPAHRLADVELVHMADPALQPAINLLELGPGDPAEGRSRVVDDLRQLVQRMMFSGLTIDATGPMFNKYFRAGLFLLMEGEGEAARIERFEDVFCDASFRRELLGRPEVTPRTKSLWKEINEVGGDHHNLANMAPWITSKLEKITQSAILRPILSGRASTIDFDRVLDEQRICLINLASVRIGPEAAGLLGGVLTQRLDRAAKRQGELEIEFRKSASVYLDEFQTFASELLRPLMAETRKFGLRVTLANQTLSQMVNNSISGGVLKEVLGNCVNTIAFGVDLADAQYLAPRFSGRVHPDQLVALPNYRAICQFQGTGGAMGPFQVATNPPPPRAKAKGGKRDA